jgi:hypothetical protein
MRASDGRLINEFGRNVPRFYNERSRTYRLPRRYNATDRY